MSGRTYRVLLSLSFVLVLACSSFTASAAAEYPLPRNAVLYSELETQLKALEAKNPSLMDYEVMGRSAGGKDLFLVTISDATAMKNLVKYQEFMQQAVNNPQTARKALKGNDIKIPVFFNASIHGNETTGTDGVLKLINRLLTDHSAETNYILKNCVILINVCQNPDGRISGYRENANGTDLNRDYITQSQPEVQAVVRSVATRWFPTAMLDLHGFMGRENVLLEPCTNPHNPNYEYDLAIKNALPHAKAIAADLTSLTKREVTIPYQVWEEGWDDYPPIFAPQYFMYLGTIGHTLEVKYPNQQGVDTVSAACWSSLKYAARNKVNLLDNQFAIYERGVKGLNIEKDVSFPEAYVIPMNQNQQRNPLEAARMISHLLENKVIVKKTDTAFSAGGTEYPEGTYVVPMKQGLRGLANTMLWNGEDISDQVSAMYDISAYSFPQLSGFNAIAVSERLSVSMCDVTEAPEPEGTLDTGLKKNYIMPVENNDAYLAANTLVKQGVKVFRTSERNGVYAPGSFLIPNTRGIDALLNGIVSEYAVNIKGITDVRGKLQPVKLQKVAVAGNDGGVATAIKALGFDVTAVPYYSLNNGFDLEKNGYDALIISGTQSFWDGSSASSGITWSLDEVGQKEIIDFAKCHDFIGVGYAGAKLNEAVGKLNTSFSYTKPGTYYSASGEEEDSQTAENGLCVMNGMTTDPVTYHYGARETVFAYAPVWFRDMTGDVITAARFAENDLYLAGFWKDPEAAAGAPVILHDKSSSYDAVLFGIEPTFRSYTPRTFGLMANALYYMGYDE